MNRKCLEGSSYFTDSPVDFQTILKLIRAGAGSSRSMPTVRFVPEGSESHVSVALLLDDPPSQCPKVAIWEAGRVQEKRRDALDLLQERVKEIYNGSLGRKVNRKSEKSKKRCLLRNRRSLSWRGAWTKGGRS